MAWAASLTAIGLVVAHSHGLAAIHTAVADRTAPRAQVRPSGVTASTTAGNQSAQLAVDGATNTFWAPDPKLPPEGQYLEFTFSAPMRLLGVVVNAGASPDPTQFLKNARPATGFFVLTSANGHKHRVPFRLADRPGSQSLTVVGANVVEVRMYISSVYGWMPGRLTAVAQVQFYKRA